ncbi:MAG: NAD-dependent epimerase/dehydratase family protein [Ignavibacteriae bacterium]|nr:NAD-dependent epimerase/dehydratase family protein [Ignavibacteriota bacterium]
MNILVTGGAGFIGSHIVDAYIEAGHNVTILDNLSTGRMVNLNSKAQFFQMDIREFAIDKIFDEGKFDVVNHHAAQMDVRKSVLDPIFDSSINILGTLNVLENCKRTGVKKFIFASTGGAIYGEQDYFPADEAHPQRPLSPYGITKSAVEKYLFYYQEVWGIRSTILRYANVYGPRQNPHGEAGVVAIFAKKMLAGEQVTINGDGKQTRDYVFIRDVVQANLLALNQKTSDTFNIGTGIETTVNEIYSVLETALGKQCKSIHAPAKEGEQLRSVLSFEKIRTSLGWQPTVSLRQGLEATVKYFQEHPTA